MNVLKAMKRNKKVVLAAALFFVIGVVPMAAAGAANLQRVSTPGPIEKYVSVVVFGKDGSLLSTISSATLYEVSSSGNLTRSDRMIVGVDPQTGGSSGVLHSTQLYTQNGTLTLLLTLTTGNTEFKTINLSQSTSSNNYWVVEVYA